MTLQPPLEGLSEPTVRDRLRIVMALAQFREEWQELVNGGSLLKVESPVGLLLADLVDKLELTAQERHVVLGARLTQEVDAFAETPVSRKFHH